MIASIRAWFSGLFSKRCARCGAPPYMSCPQCYAGLE